MRREERSWGDGLILFAAEGFGVGRIPFAPGTFGTLLGFGWIYLLLFFQNVYVYLAGVVAGFFIAVWVGGEGERICGKKDPGSIVIDEIAALPLAFFGVVIAKSAGSWTPNFGYYLAGRFVLTLLVVFVGFRFFDVVKPWVIGRSQGLPGGWGLVVDDFLAALHVLPLGYLTARAVQTL